MTRRLRLLPVAAALALVACGGPQVDQAQVEDALDAVATWLAADDDAVDTSEALRRAERLLDATGPVVQERPEIAGFDESETATFHDALAGLRESVARQRDALAGCDLPDPGACLARSDLDPAALAVAVTRFQQALAPLDRSRA